MIIIAVLQVKKQSEKRQSLQLAVDSLPAPTRLPASPPQLETHSPPMYSTVRRIQDANSISSPVVVNQGGPPKSFSGSVSVLATPSLGPRWVNCLLHLEFIV